MKIQKSKEVTITVNDVTAIQCDRCKKEYDIHDYLETQEFHHINFTGGYGSVFGDGYQIECDLCQRCLYELISPFMREE